MKISSLPLQEILSASPNESVASCLETMNRKNVGSVLVMEGERLVGIVTERDILRMLSNYSGEKLKGSISEIMTANPMTISDECDIADAEMMMAKGKFRHLPVQKMGKIVSMISSKDIFETLHAQNSINKLQLDTIRAIITTVCHEINNPLTIANMGLSKLKQSNPDNDFSRIENSMIRINEVIKKLSTLQDVVITEYAGGAKMIDLNSQMEKLNLKDQKAK